MGIDIFLFAILLNYKEIKVKQGWWGVGWNANQCNLSLLHYFSFCYE